LVRSFSSAIVRFELIQPVRSRRVIDEELWRAIASGLPSYLDRQRWYADKLRPISSLSTIDCASVHPVGGRILLCLVRIDYEIGDSRRYFVPMTVHAAPTPERFTITDVDQDGVRWWIQDALPDALFRDFLVEAGRGLTLDGIHGVFDFEPWMLDGAPFELEPATQSAATALEQSNSSIAYGLQAMAKIYRRLEIGQNIEVDMNRYLTTEAGFGAIPKLISAAAYRGSDGGIPLILVQQHVGDHRDCWTALTEQLRHRASGSLDFAEALGRVTGEMHVALAAAPANSRLAPERITPADVQRWEAQFRGSAQETDWITGERLTALPDRSQAAAHEYLGRTRDWNDRASWFDLLGGLYKTRVHGDYHLGQVLVTKDGRLLVVDFEGEPQRPAHEREAKYSPLKDVAGMLRSLNYATGVVASSLDVEAVAESRAWLEHWERDARARFLGAYRASIASAPVPIAPTNDQDFARALSVMELDKAFYEVRYELSSRPDWAWLPLDSLK
jgi:maltose alpha-D-glucosyltransferase/alpha-amylase